MHELPSKLLNNAVEEFAKLPGIGRKTALRLTLYLLKQPGVEVESFANAFITLKKDIKQCKICHNYSDTEVCEICGNQRRNHSVVCVVENIKDVISIENTHQYEGVYHVLGGIISPIEGIGPADLEIESLVQRVKQGTVSEVILALSTTMEGETTCYYLYKKLQTFPVDITTIARGVAFGNELEYTDELTLGRSIKNRTPFQLSE